MDEVYDDPLAYEIAYSFRDIPGEVAFLRRQVTAALGREPVTAAELGAGPAPHARALAAAGVTVWAIDHNPAALAWLTTREPALQPVIADLTEFRLPAPVELVYSPLGGFAYLLDDMAWRASLAACRRALVPGGVLVLELLPADADRAEAETWTVSREELTVIVTAGPAVLESADIYAWELALRLTGEGGTRFGGRSSGSGPYRRRWPNGWFGAPAFPPSGCSPTGARHDAGGRGTISWSPVGQPTARTGNPDRAAG